MARSRSVTQAPDVDATAFLGLVAILIPLLLMAYGPMQLAIVDSVLPGICASPCGETDAKPTTVNPVIAITRQGFTLSGLAALEGLDGDGTFNIPCATAGCPELASYDTAELTRLLALAKDQFPESEHVTIVPDGRVPYAALILAMDAARAEVAIPGEGQPRELFPFPTIAGGSS